LATMKFTNAPTSSKRATRRTRRRIVAV
jgi:hypothetical protein